MADVTPATLRCLALCDTRFGASSLAASGVDGASYTQAGGGAGRAIGTTTSTPALTASGAQSEAVEVYTVRGGTPGAASPLVGDELDAPPGQVWRHPGDALYRGWEAPTAIGEAELLDYTTTANAYLWPHLASRDGGAYLAVQRSQRYTEVWARPLGGAWGSAAVGTVYDAGSAVYTGATRSCPALVALASGRLLCLFWIPDAVTPGIHSAVSDDGGVTWSRPQLCDGVLSFLGIPPRRIRAAESNGQVMMLVYLNSVNDSVSQYASIDGGASFTIVGIVGDTKNGYADVVGVPGGFVVATIEQTTPSGLTPPTATTPAYTRRVASAFDLAMSSTAVLAQAAVSTSEWGTQAAGVLTDGELTLVREPSGTLWLFGIDFDGAALRAGVVSRSDDDGQTWTTYPDGWWRGLDASTRPTEIAAVCQGGRVIVAHNVAANPATHDASLFATYLGGYCTVPRAPGSPVVSLAQYVSPWTVTWLPFDLPENTGATWTYTPVGLVTVAFSGLGMRVTHGGAASASWAATPGGNNSQGVTVLADVRANGSSAYVTARAGDAGPASYEATVTVSPTQLVLSDAGGAIATLATTEAATGVQILLSIGDTVGGVASGQVQAWWRPWGSAADREFVLLGSSGTVPRGVATTNRVEFGTNAAIGADCYFRAVCYSTGSDAGIGSYASALTVNPSGLVGLPIGPAPYPVADTGLSLAMAAGPVVTGDSWTIEPRYAYGIDRIDPATSPSPAAVWRSTSDLVDQRIVWSFDEATTIDASLACVYLDGANFATATFAGWDGAAWVTIATIDLRFGSSLKFTRLGAVVRCGTGGGSAIVDYIERGALRGATMRLAAGQYRRVATNTGGRWNGLATTHTRPTLTLAAPVPGDATSGTGAELWSPRGATIIRDALAVGYTRFSLLIGAQPTVEGYYTLGVCMIGGCQVLGTPDTARQIGTVTNVETTESRGGQRSKRRRGLPRRYVVVSWTDGIDGTNVQAAAPNYVTDYTAGVPIATPAAMATDLHSVIYEQDVCPVVYLPLVPVPALGSGVTQITAADLMLYATVETDTLQTDVVLGDEHKDEMVRVGSVRLEEVL